MNKKILIGVVIAIALPFAIYTGSPLFINTSTNEPLPQTTPLNDTSTESPKILLTGQFIGVGDGIHNAEGIAKVVSLADGKEILRFEDFKSTNGPDLFVYLATDNTATDFVSLGELKANIGNQNYEIPEGTDLTKYDTALVWCKSFSVLFGHAELS